MTKGLEVVHRLSTEGCFPHLMVAVLISLDFQSLALASLMFEMVYAPTRSLHSWLEHSPPGKGLEKTFYGFAKNSLSKTAAFRGQRFYFSKILSEYTASRFYTLCQELRWTYAQEFVFTTADNGRLTAKHKWGLVDRIYYPMIGLLKTPSAVGLFDVCSVHFNPVADYLAVCIRDFQSFTFAVFRFGSEKGCSGKLSHHFTGCARLSQWVDLNWSADGRYLLAVEYMADEKCRPHLLYIGHDSSVVRLKFGADMPNGKSRNQSAKCWCPILGGFFWLGNDGHPYFVKVDGERGTSKIGALSGSPKVIESIRSSSKIITLSDPSLQSGSRIGWISNCDEDHGECNCNTGHDNIYWTHFDLFEIFLRPESCTLTCSGLVLDLIYDEPTKRLIFASIPVSGCKIGPANETIYLTGRYGQLECIEKGASKFNCPNLTYPLLVHEVLQRSDERFLLVSEFQTGPLLPREFSKYHSNRAELGCYRFKELARRYAGASWSKWILSSVTDDIVIVANKTLNCEITVFRNQKCTSVRDYHSTEGPYFRHRSKPYFIKKKWWISNNSIIDVCYVTGSSTYLLSHRMEASFLESEYTQVRELKNEDT